jgi:hypothetical protein
MEALRFDCLVPAWSALYGVLPKPAEHGVHAAST